MNHLVPSRGSITLPRRFHPIGWQPAGFLIIAALVGMVLARLPLMWVGLLLAAVTFVILTLIQPLLGLGLTLLAGPFGALEKITLGGRLPDSAQLLFLLTLAIWLARGIVQRRIRLQRMWLAVPLSLFIFLAATSLLRAPSMTGGLKELFKWVEIALVMLMVTDLTRDSGADHKKVKRAFEKVAGPREILMILLIAGLSQALIGIWQFGLRGTGPEHFGILGGYYRAYGTFEQPNPFGGYVNLTLWLAAGTSLGLGICVWQSRTKRSKNGKINSFHQSRPSRLQARFAGVSLLDILSFTLIASAALSSGLALLFSWSRGAWLGSVAGAVAVVMFLPRDLKRGILLFIVLGVLVILLFNVGTQFGLVPAGLVERLSGFVQELQFGDVRGVDINDTNYSVLERLAHWQAAVDMARENLWWGVGFGNYEHAYSEYALINWPYALGHAHNYYLNLLAELGVLGLTAYLIFWGAVLWQITRVLRHSIWPERGIVLGLLAAFVAFSVHQLVDKLYVNNIYLHLGVMLGLLQSLDDRSEIANTSSEVAG